MRFLVVLLACVCLSSGQQDQNVCKPPSDIGPDGHKYKAPDDPKVSQTFETHIMLNILTKNFTTEMHQFYDYEGDHEVIEQREYGHRENAYASYSTDEFIAIQPDAEKNQCTVTKLSTDPNRFIFGYKKTTAGGHVPPANSILHLLEQDEYTIKRYIGKQQVRGIPCNVWYTCVYWEDFKSTMDVYWYFNDPDSWRPANSIPGQPDPKRDSIPVRAWVKGRHHDTLATFHDFEHKYEIFHWKTFIDRPYFWQTSRGVSCPGRKDTRPLPAMPQQFSFTIEQVVQGLDLVYFIKESYDFNEKFFQFEYRADMLSGNLALFGDRMLREVHDFNTGIAYVIDTMRGNCSVKPIEHHNLDDKDLSNDPTHLRIRSVAEFFYTDGVKPTYEGVKTIRGVDADVWVYTKANFPMNGTNSTFEFAFLAKTIPGSIQWTSLQQKQATEKVAQLPLQLTMTLNRLNAKPTTYNIFNFRSVAPDLLSFSVKSCFWNRNKRIFSFQIDSQYHDLVFADMTNFKRGLLAQVVRSTGISKLRVGQIQVTSMYKGKVGVRVVILDTVDVNMADVKQLRPPVTLIAAGDALLAALRNGAFKVSPMNGDNGISSQPIPIMVGTVHEREYIKQAPFVGYGTGAQAATAIVMLLVGIALGCVVAVFIKRKFMS